ncbi:hypothetical protein ACHAXR_011474 [Thalassiosira sp. AJA248-18]
MVDTDDGSRSPGEGSSSKSSKKNEEESENDNDNQSSKPIRKKKAKRRSSSQHAASDTDTSDVETGNKKSSRKKSSKSKRQSADRRQAGEGIEDSMLVAIKNKRKTNTNGQEGRKLSRDVSFSGSTIVRDLKKKKSGIIPTDMSLEVAMGKLPQPALKKSESNDTNEPVLEPTHDELMAFMGKMPQPSSKKGGIKPSKYGDSKRNGISFAVEEPKWKIGLDSDKPTATSDLPRKNKPTLRSVDFSNPDDDDDDDDNKPNPLPSSYNPKRMSRSSSMSSIDGSSRKFRKDPQSIDGMGGHNRPDRQLSWQPELGGVGRQKSRRRSATGDEGELNSSLTAQRPGIKRRNSMSSTMSPNQRLSFDAHDSNAGDKVSEHSLLKSAKTVAAFQQHKHLRRMEMSMEGQTFIPPKSRQTSMFQAFTHLVAGRFVDLILWTYGASFLKVTLFFLAFYALNIFIWAAVLDAVDIASGGRCIHDNVEQLSRSDRYEFAVELAWATFTTVGYGTISPQGDTTGCYAIRFTCAFVAFIGVLFASQTAAIMYSKLMRLLAKAHVTFSSALCVQYGKGNEGSTVRFGQLNFRASVAPTLLKTFSEQDLMNDSDDGGEAMPDSFPVIEFRMINDRANHEGSEIWDAQIRGIVQLHKQPSEIKTRNTDSFALKDKATGGESTLDLEKKVYYPISLSPDTHPHFSRIWYARHVLNAESPLLKREIRDMIVKDGGKWDKDFNNWEEIRDCLNEFISLRITLSGTSAVSASTVFGEHVYEFNDVCVGWRFANMVYEKRRLGFGGGPWRRLGFSRAPEEDQNDSADVTDTRTKIDAALLHDIVPQVNMEIVLRKSRFLIQILMRSLTKNDLLPPLQPGGDYEPLNETKNAMVPSSFFLKMFTLGLYDG